MDKTSANYKPGILDEHIKEISFSNLEIQCVLQLLQHNSVAKIAINLGLTQKSVRFYLMNAGQKLRTIGQNDEVLRRKNKHK